MSPYSFVVGAEVQFAFTAANYRDQRVLLDAFRELAEHPFRSPDWYERDTDNRLIAVVIRSDWTISYWSDHAVRRVLILSIGIIEDP